MGNATSPVVLGDSINQGTLLYTGAATTYTRGFTVNAGGGQLTNSGTGDLTVSTGGVVTNGLFTVGGAPQNITINSTISGVGGATKTGADTVTFTGANTYTGKTTVQAGTLVLGTAAQNAVLSLGGADLQAGKIVFDYTGGTTPAATVAGLLRTSYNAGAWNVGQFQSTTADSTHGLGWVDDGVSQVKVAYTFYGDADLNGTVNSADLAKVLANYNMAGMVWSQGDFDYNGTVNSADLAKVLANYNLALPDPGISGGLADLDAGAIALLAEKGGEVSAVPEPSTAALLLGGLLGLLAWRRRG